MIVNFDKIIGVLSLIFAVIFVARGFFEISETVYLVVSVLYLVFAVISLFFRVRQNSKQKAQEGEIVNTDAIEKRDKID